MNISDNQKITLTLGQLRQLVRESSDNSIVGASAIQLDRMFAKHGFKRTNAHNIRINGQLRGASGFWRKGDCVIYVNTEGIGSRRGVFGNLGGYMRIAKDEKDYNGGVNQNFKSEEEFHDTVKRLYKQFKGEIPNNSSNDIFGFVRFEDGAARKVGK